MALNKNSTALMHDRGWVSLRQFCKIANISYPTALRWVKIGHIRYVQVGGIKRIYQEELARFLKEGTLPPDPEAWEKMREYQRQYEAGYKARKAEQSDD